MWRQEELYWTYTNFGGLNYSGSRYNAGTNAAVASTRLHTFTCPSDKPQWLGGNTKHNYVLNAGNTSFYQGTLPIGCTCMTAGSTIFHGAPFNWYNNDPDALAQGSDATMPFDGPAPPDGPNAADGLMGRPVYVTEITTERAIRCWRRKQHPGPRERLAGIHLVGGAAGFTSYLAPNSSQPDIVTGGDCLDPGVPSMPCSTISTNSAARMMAARSLHAPGGVNVVMCDGSVRFLANTIGMPVWGRPSPPRGVRS